MFALERKQAFVIVTRLYMFAEMLSPEGYCEYCGHPVREAQNACSAYNKMYHLACFRCYSCGKLERGKY